MLQVNKQKYISKLMLYLNIIFYLNWFIIVNYFFMSNTVTAAEGTTKYILVFDNNTINNKIDKKPKQYRSGVNLTPKINASASAQPNVNDFKYIINKAKTYTKNQSNKEIFIIDLRQEPHAILNEYAISWYGFRNQVPNNLENQLIKQLSNQKNVRVYKGLDKLIDGYVMPKGYSLIKVHKILPEKLLIEKELGVNYLRILVTDHFAPKNHEIDLFVNFIKQLPENSWLHFHCRGGKGRSTTFMAMYDMIQNGNKLTLDAILKRQYKLGGSKLSNTNSFLERSQWKEPSAKDRYNFIKNFYNYVLDPNGYNKLNWSEWLKQHSDISNG